MTIAFPQAWLAIILWPAISCTTRTSPNTEMIKLLSTIAGSERSVGNTFASETKMKHFDSLLQVAVSYPDSATAIYGMANTLLELGQEEKTIHLLEGLLIGLPPYMPDNRKIIMKNLAIAYLRLGERKNCIYAHNGESCILPIANKGVHVNKQGAEKAIDCIKNC